MIRLYKWDRFRNLGIGSTVTDAQQKTERNQTVYIYSWLSQTVKKNK